MTLHEEIYPSYVTEDLFPVLRDHVAWPQTNAARRKALMRAGGTPNPRLTAMPVVVRALLGCLNTEFERQYDSVTVNFYTTGDASLGWHSDEHDDYDQQHPMAILSFGAARHISFRPVGARSSVRDVLLTPGSLLVMPGGFQETFEHAILPAAPTGPRISLMFSRIPLG